MVLCVLIVSWRFAPHCSCSMQRGGKNDPGDQVYAKEPKSTRKHPKSDHFPRARRHPPETWFLGSRQGPKTGAARRAARSSQESSQEQPGEQPGAARSIIFQQKTTVIHGWGIVFNEKTTVIHGWDIKKLSPAYDFFKNNSSYIGNFQRMYVFPRQDSKK